MNIPFNMLCVSVNCFFNLGKMVEHREGLHVPQRSMLAVRGGLAAERDRQIRLQSVHADLLLDLPPSIPLPDGEEIPYGSSSRLHIRDSEQESEISQKCIRAPPNRTVFEGESPPPYRSAALHHHRSHHHHPHRWSEETSGSGSRLSGLTMVPCLTMGESGPQQSGPSPQPPSRQV